MEVQLEAKRRVDMLLLARVREHGHTRLAPMRLTDYADTETFHFLLQGNRWTFDEWHAINQEAVRLLQAEGFQVQLVKITLRDYSKFLTHYDLKDDPHNRVHFVSWMIAPESQLEPPHDQPRHPAPQHSAAGQAATTLRRLTAKKRRPVPSQVAAGSALVSAKLAEA